MRKLFKVHDRNLLLENLGSTRRAALVHPRHDGFGAKFSFGARPSESGTLAYSPGYFLTLHDALGRTLWVSVDDQGAYEQLLVGVQPWCHAVDDDREKLRGAFALCLLDSQSITVSATLDLDGRKMRYRSTLFSVTLGSVAVACMNQRVPVHMKRLTSRERELLVAYAKGATTREIAQAFGVTRSTVNTYRQRICRKLGLRGIQELTAFAAEHFRADLMRGS